MSDEDQYAFDTSVSSTERASGVKTITSRANERNRARTAVHGLVVHRHGIAKRLRAAVFLLIGIVVLHGAWRPFVQAASIDVQFTAAVAVADCLLQEPR